MQLLSFEQEQNSDLKYYVSSQVFVLTAPRIIIHSQAYKAFSNIVNTIVLIVVSYHFWTLFPFDMSVFHNPDLWYAIFRFLIIAVPVGSIIGAAGDLIKLAVKSDSK